MHIHQNNTRCLPRKVEVLAKSQSFPYNTASSMISLSTALSFFALSVVLALSPGPDNVFVLLQSALRGPKAGICFVLGLCTGLLGHTSAVALGLAALFATSATAFNLVKFAGAAYLAWMAWGALRAPAMKLGHASAEPLSLQQMYRRGILMNLTNPKVAVFFLAFLPQFVRPDAGPVSLQIVCLGAVFMLATLIVFSTIAWFSGVFGQILQKSERSQWWLNRLSGLIFLGLAIKLLLAQR